MEIWQWRRVAVLTVTTTNQISGLLGSPAGWITQHYGQDVTCRLRVEPPYCRCPSCSAAHIHSQQSPDSRSQATLYVAFKPCQKSQMRWQKGTQPGSHAQTLPDLMQSRACGGTTFYPIYQSLEKNSECEKPRFKSLLSLRGFESSSFML